MTFKLTIARTLRRLADHLDPPPTNNITYRVNITGSASTLAALINGTGGSGNTAARR